MKSQASSVAQVIEWPSDRFTELVRLAELDPAVDLRDLPLSGIVIASEEDVSGYDFSGCIMRRATLRGVDLRGAKLVGTDLTGADLTEALYRPDQLATAITEGAKGIGDRRDRIPRNRRRSELPVGSPLPIQRRIADPEWHHPFHVDRVDLVRKLSQRIASGGDCILYGQKGVGKTALLTRVIKSLPKHGAFQSFVISGLRGDDPPGFVLMKSILQQGEGTFFDKFSEAFISRGRLSPLIARFDPQFCEQLEEEAKLFGGVYPLEEMLIRLSDEERVTLFRDAVRWVQDVHSRGTKILFIFDDADRLSEFEDLIEVTGHLDEATFIFILNEPSGREPDFSFGHRFAGGVFQVPGLSGLEVDAMVDRIEAWLGNGVSFSSEARAAIFSRSQGLPSWVTRFAERALDHARHRAKAELVKVGVSDVEAVIRLVIEQNEPGLVRSLNVGLRRAGHYGYVVFRAVHSARTELSETDIIGLATGQQRRSMRIALEELKSAGVLVTTRNGVKLAHPLLKALFDIDQQALARARRRPK